MNSITTTELPTRRTRPQESERILAECRDRAVQRLHLAMLALLDSMSGMLIQRAGNTDVREEQTAFLDARQLLLTRRAEFMTAFEKSIRERIDERLAGKAVERTDYTEVDGSNLELVDNTTMEESVLKGNIVRGIENLCYEELHTLTRAMSYLLADPDVTIAATPFSPRNIVDAFARALAAVEAKHSVKFALLRELNQSSLADLNDVYADLNQHLNAWNAIPTTRSRIVNRGGASSPGAAAGAAAGSATGTTPTPTASGSGELDIVALFKRMFGTPGPAASTQGGAFGGAAGGPAMGGAPGGPATAGATAGAGPAWGGGEAAGGAPGAYPAISPLAQYVPTGPLPPTPMGYVPGAPIMVTPELGAGLSRLQHGEVGFEVGGAMVEFLGVPAGTHNVLRDLQQSPLGQRVSQLESMTIELVAMLFDFIFETKDLPDGIKALIARLQIPVLKAALLDAAFFAKKEHPSRLLVNELAQAGLGWSPAMGADDPLYRKLDEIVHRILDGFSDDLAIFEDMRAALLEFLQEEETAAELNIQTSADEVTDSDRRQLATSIARSEVERRIEGRGLPQFLAMFLRTRWVRALERNYLEEGEESDSWRQRLATLEDLVWSVQPKKNAEDRKRLVALLPSLLKRMTSGLQPITWEPGEREEFMAHLVEAHAAAVKPSAATSASPTTDVAEQARAQAEQAKAAGDAVAAAKAERLAEAMAPAAPAPLETPSIIQDQYLEIAQSLDRGMWVEFEDADGQLSFAKLAWVSPLRGTYLFTNRQGHKALSLNAHELAQRFRDDNARLVEAEPLIDRAFTNLMANIDSRLQQPLQTH